MFSNGLYKKKIITSSSGFSFYKTKNNISVLRKSRIFLKSRFSRNRQWCRPIVFWSVWFNILFVGFASTVFYGFKFSTSSVPLVFMVFVLSTILARVFSIKK